MARVLRQEGNGLLLNFGECLGAQVTDHKISRLRVDCAAACASGALSSLAVRAEQSCAPKTNAAKILRSKNVNDVDPNWAPPAFIGMSWSLIETRQEGGFLSGVLVNPRGGALPGRVFVIASEWDCG